jgi:hypothetical protein
MTINRTTLLDLPLPVTGTESGTWGDVTNNGLSQYVDIAVAGMNALTSSDFTAGALTISNTQGDSGGTNIAAGSAQYATIKVSSLATNSTITAPASNRSYRIVNLDSTYNLTIKASGQTGITFLPGQTGVVAFTGTDYEVVGVVNAASSTDNAIPKFDGTTGQIIQNTGVTIDDSNNVSGVAQLNATTADLTNIEVTNIKAKDGTSAGSIADSTGVVTLASSVLTTTDINGGTIDGAVIGGASAAAGSFTTLNTSGQVVFNDAGADVDFRVEGDTDVNLLFVDASADSVGIGTNAPSTILHINKASGETLVRTEVASGSEVGFDIVKTGATNQHWRIADGSVLNGTLEIYDVTNSRSNFRTSSTQSVFNESGADIDFRVEGDTDANLLFVDAGNDRVGIGTNEPGTRLEVGGADTVIRLRDSNGGVTDFGNDATGTYWRDYTNDTFRWLRTVGTETMRLTSDGYLRLAGGGIQFNGDTAAANALDDYEEGTWTAVITTTGGSTTIGSQTCTYTKVGRLVTLNGIIQVSGISSPTGQLTITGLPFTPAVANQGGSNVYMTGVAATSATSFFSEVGTAPRIYIAIYTELDNLADAAGLLTASSLFKFSAFYSV